MAKNSGKPLVEAIPNLSEGSRTHAIETLAEAWRGVDGLWLLDIHSDRSHNRSVFTAVVELEALPKACERLFEVALETIDLRTHRGAHPRIGAVDVLPFVPLSTSGSDSFERARELTRSIASELAKRFDLPIFLYERAGDGRGPALHELRRGGSKALAKRLKQGTIVPDFGPRRLHRRAGATAIGLRDFLIAFNVDLATSDLALAKTIARRIRASDGGLPAVKALGFYHHERGVAQVSMNLTDFRVSSLIETYEAVRQLAGEADTELKGSEIVGLIPRAALVAGMRHRLKLAEEPRVLEEMMERLGLPT